MHISASTLPDQNGTIKPTGNGSSFFYTPSNRPPTADQLSPRSSSPDSSAHASDSSESPPPRSLSSSPAAPMLSSSPPLRRRTRIVAEGNFTVEEFADSDYEDWDSDDEDEVIRPHQYEDAESDRAPSVSVKNRNNDLDTMRIVSDFQNLHCENEEERELWLEKLRAEKRRRRRSSASVQKRTLSMSIGSDTDDEDLKPVTFEGANEAGSSARRLRRKVGERTSLIFDDPPPRIEEEDEGPESVEEVVEIREEDEDEDVDRELRELPYWYIQEMDVDSDDNE
ncbi:uncharacterized protein LY89DRAFT_698465 [Mollisia scopiformis]|uniref:Uncharacterized protein n=1 Tax=Mollisia scopiformis TaxID=149040 RepID=A0A194X3Z3_MOLSC|nr:uncharacterized protein LY89DRAFT_698465 [Mollisia scopiformis]KUJ14886.1 hypothetical protein LY89DRAFT_698465 [Mollisia scopiformis]